MPVHVVEVLVEPLPLIVQVGVPPFLKCGLAADADVAVRPIAKTAIGIRELQPGELLEAYATDPGSVPDFHAWSKTTGNELVEQTEEDGVFRFLIRKV